MQKPGIKALFFDVDGTLIGLKSHQLNETDVASLAALKEKGYLLFIATGRDFCIPEEIVQLKPIMQYLTGYVDVNGQHCALTDGTEISSHPLSDEDFIPMRAVCEREHLSMLYRAGNSNYITEMTDRVARYWVWMGIDAPEVRPMDPGIRDIPKLCIHCSEEEEERFLKPLMKHTWTARITPDLIDMIPEGVGKAEGIREICRYFGIRIEETMGFGDGQNDLDMLNLVGTAVAMENAADNIKAAADHVTAVTEEAGITQALRHFGLL